MHQAAVLLMFDKRLNSVKNLESPATPRGASIVIPMQGHGRRVALEARISRCRKLYTATCGSRAREASFTGACA